MQEMLIMALQLALFFGAFFLPHVVGTWWPKQFMAADREDPAAWNAYHTSGQAIGAVLAILVWIFDFWFVPRLFS